MTRSGPDPLGTPAPRPTGAQPDRLYEIDLLRIIAAVAVVIYHYTFSGFASHLTEVGFPGLSVITRYGYLGVDLFFLISGFVVLLSAWNRTPEKFVVSRIVRLYPAFWVAVTLTAIVSVTLSRGVFPVSIVQYLANLTMFNSLPNIENVDVVYWTLWAEIRFYLLVFVLTCVGITRQRVIGVLWAWLAATFLLQAGFLPAGLHGVLDLAVQSTFSHYFIAGMALCVIHRSGGSWSLWAIIAISLGNALFRGAQFAAAVADRYQTELNTVVVLVTIVLIFVVICLIALRVTRSLGKPWFSTAGSLTYPLYLVHAHIGFVIFVWLGPVVPGYVLLVGTTALMFGVAWLIHITAERRFAPVLKRVLDRWATALRNRISPPQPPAPPAPQRPVDEPTEFLTVPITPYRDGGPRPAPGHHR
ncbi:acyltransferase family protein [Umezawaea beigongshangensis]|uniref:acyltransferase family protein n=1 Tax=Umezawaea beigongshangensis TaxID=2780383 RepID=UPI0018F1D79E|nr:acyltransferase [Umezawaea beigongshangensis]